jgi:uncharacterized membrane protein YfcA
MNPLIWVALIALAAGLVKGLTGFGSSLVTIPLLSMIYPIEEVVIMMLTFNVLLNTILLVKHNGFSRQSIDYVWPISLTGIVGTFIGLTLLQTLDGSWISFIAGTLILFAVFNKLFRLKVSLNESILTKMITGLFSGFGNGIASIDGPPVVFYLTGVNATKIKFKNTLAFHFLMMGLIAVIMLIFKDMYTLIILKQTLYFAVFASISVLIGIGLSKKMNEALFERMILFVLILLAISLFV